MPMLVLLKEQNGTLVPDYFLRASHLDNNLDEANNPEWKTLVIDETTGASSRRPAPSASAGARRASGT
jgi:nitrate reductase alpha subunit